MCTRTLRICCVLFAFLVVPVSFAQPAPSAAGVDALANYTLTIDSLTRYVATFHDLKPVFRAKPALAKGLDTDAVKMNFEQLAAIYSSRPELVAVLARHGFTPLTFQMETMSLTQASVAIRVKPANQSDVQFAQANHVNPANIAFVRNHPDEITAILKGLYD